jgi:hypothetical protein
MNYGKRLAALEQSSRGEDPNVIVVLLHPGEDDATKAEKIAEAKHALGLAENDTRPVIVVRFGAHDDGRDEKMARQTP